MVCLKKDKLIPLTAKLPAQTGDWAPETVCISWPPFTVDLPYIVCYEKRFVKHISKKQIKRERM
jgi:hypothetical protein